MKVSMFRFDIIPLIVVRTIVKSGENTKTQN